MKLHLGCGQRYLEGYVNIDFPSSSHPVQDSSVADLNADILDLRYPAATIDEIRLHHLFEHFERPVACALLAGWFSWLQTDGLLHIEVPDFQKTARIILSAISSAKERGVAERHLFGSHEAAWAIHCEGYTPAMLKKMLEDFGFAVQRIRKNSWKGTHNFEILAKKPGKNILRDDFEQIASRYLTNYLLDDSASEMRLLKTWMRIFNRQIKTSWAQSD